MAISFLLLFVVAEARAALYWGTGASIARANLDGSVVDTTFIQRSGSSVCAIAVDSSHIYWADSYKSTIGRANLDGSAVEDGFITLDQETMPCGLAVSSSFIYWANMGTGTIGRARLDGSEIDASFVPAGQHPCAVAVNQAGIYWASDDEHQIWRTDIGGINGPEVIVHDATDPCGIALMDSHLFWVNSEVGTVSRANLDGSEALPEFITGGHYPVSLTIHESHLYWANIDSGFESIGRGDVDGANVNQALVGGLKYPYALAVDSVQVAPPPAAVPPGPSRFRVGKLRRQRDGAVLFPVDLFGDGWLEAAAQGANVEVQPEGVEGRATLEAGRKWLKISPTTKSGNGSRCVRRVFRRGGKVKLTLRLRFAETGKVLAAARKPFLLFKPPKGAQPRSKESSRAVSCHG